MQIIQRLRRKPKLSVLVKKYLQANGRLAPNTQRLTEMVWENMVAITSDIRVNGFTPSKAEKVQSIWIRRYKGTSTALSYRKTVSPVFSWAIDRGYIKEHPFVKKVKPPRVTKRKAKAYNRLEFKKLLWACNGDIRWIAILLTARTTGMRKSEIQNLTRADIDFEAETITVREKPDSDSTWHWQPKDREERVVPLVTDIANILTELIWGIPQSQPYVFLKPSRYYYLMELKKAGVLADRLRGCPITNFDLKFRKIKRAAGVTGRFHDLRSTCLTDLASVLNPNELALIAGHSDTETTMRYIAIGDDAVSKAREKVSASLRALPTPSQAR